MKVTQKLLGYLNRIFDKNPKAFNAFTINDPDGMSWVIADQVMTITLPVYPGSDQTIDLTQYTLFTLTAYLATLPDVSISGFNPGQYGAMSAVVLMDGSGTAGVPIQGYTSLLWVSLDAIAQELHYAYLQVANAPNEMSTATGDGEWLDFLGVFYNVPRNAGELDAAYGPRIIATVIRPLSNNVAIQVILAALYGYAVTVTDVIEYGAVVPAFDGAHTFDGAIDYNTSAAPLYGLFDVNFTGTGLTGAAVTAFQATVRAQVEFLRAAGTHLRRVDVS